MTEQTSAFAVPAALASLVGQKRIADAPSAPPAEPAAEKGFYRVSGRKLISVLESGGDGYSDPVDPRASMLSDSSYNYRNSVFPGGLSPGQLLQLGSPMRPTSGVMVMRSGPGRTPVQLQNPFDDEHARPMTPPTIDPVGRTLLVQDGSRASGASRARFTEDM